MFSWRRSARDLRLVDQHLDEVVVLGEVREHALDRDQVRRAVRVEGLGAIDLGHAAERDAIEQVVAAELLRRTAWLNESLRARIVHIQ